eukprot:g290.t1
MSQPLKTAGLLKARQLVDAPHKRQFRHASQAVVRADELSGKKMPSIECDYPVNMDAYHVKAPLCDGCQDTQCSRHHRGRQRQEAYWIKCDVCSKWRDVSNCEQRRIIADAALTLPRNHECGCQRCVRVMNDTPGMMDSKPDLKGPVPCELVEKAFEDSLGVLLEEYTLKDRLKRGECTQAELDAAITRTRKFFVSRVESYGEGKYATSIITKQFRRRKCWYESEFQSEVEAARRVAEAEAAVSSSDVRGSDPR